MDLSQQRARRIQTVSTLPEHASGKGMSASAIMIAPDNRFLYVTNRDEGHREGDAIVWFSIPSDGATLSRAGELRSGVQHPRAASLVGPIGDYLVTGSPKADGVVIFSRNTRTGDLTLLDTFPEVIAPSSFLAV